MPTHTSVRVEWGDGSTNNYTTSVTPYTTPQHTYYNTNLSTTVKVRVFSGTLQIDEQTATIALPDTAKPVVGTFTLGAFTSPNVAITAFTATDNADVAGPPAVSGVTGYLVTNSATAPLAAAITSATAPASYTFVAPQTAGLKTLYAWVKDAAGNVSLAKTATVTITAIP
jgi:hypothetical protein